MLWSRRIVPVVLALTALLEGCSSPSSSKPGILRLPLYPGELVADPARAAGLQESFFASLLYSGLVRFGPDLHVIPDLAVSIPTISGDGSSYTFTVRRDARFADGSSCTAADIAYSLARALSPRTHSALARRYLGNIRGAAAVERGRTSHLAGVEVLHRLTLRILLAHPDATFLEKLAFPQSFAVDPRIVRQHALNLRAAAGTGPWSVSGRGRDGSLVLSPRKHYYGGLLQLRSLTLLPVRDEQNALDMYKKGAIDAAYVAPDRFKSWSARSDFHSTAALTAYYAIPAPGTQGAWSAPDRQRLVQQFAGALTPLTSIVPPAVPDYVAATVPQETPSSPLAADTIRLDQTRNSVLYRLGRALSSQMRKGVGARAHAVTVVQETYLLPVPGVWLSMILPRTSSRWFRHTLRETSNLTNDPVSRMSIYSTLEQWALAKQFVIPLANSSIGYAIKPAVSGLQVTALGLMPDNGIWNTVQVA